MTAVQTGDLLAPVLFGRDGAGDGEFFEPLATENGVRVERIVSEGHVSPEGFWYDQEEWEWVAVLQGSAKLEFEGHGVLSLTSGRWALIPAHVRHRVIETSASPQCVWLAVFGENIRMP